MLTKYATAILRLGLSAVFLVFGIDKFIDWTRWSGWIAPWMQPMIEAVMPLQTFLILVGIVETITGLLLLFGLYWRFAAILAAIQLVGISISVGLNEITLRDFGLLAGAVALALSKETRFALDNRRAEHRVRLKLKKKYRL